MGVEEVVMAGEKKSGILERSDIHAANLVIPVGSEESLKKFSSPATPGTPLSATLRMGEGVGEASYTRNSHGQASINGVLKPFLGEAIRQLDFPKEGPIRAADLGCSIGANALSFADYITESVRQACRPRAIEVPEIQYFFSDLPTNDFNTLFLQMLALREEEENESTGGAGDSSEKSKPYFAAAVPGSFYDRLFPQASLHIIICAWSLHWISEVPESVLDKTSPAYNKGRAWINSGNPEVAEEYSKISKKDLLAFFTNRATELASGGLLFVMCLSRKDEDRKEIQFGSPLALSCPMSGLFELAWQDLVEENLISEETRDSFNLPVYCPSYAEIKEAVDATSSFHIKALDIWQDIDFLPKAEDKNLIANPDVYGAMAMNMGKTMMHSLVEAHIGADMASKLWDRVEKHAIADCQRNKSVFCCNSPGGNVALVILVRK